MASFFQQSTSRVWLRLGNSSHHSGKGHDQATLGSFGTGGHEFFGFVLSEFPHTPLASSWQTASCLIGALQTIVAKRVGTLPCCLQPVTEWPRLAANGSIRKYLTPFSSLDPFFQSRQLPTLVCVHRGPSRVGPQAYQINPRDSGTLAGRTP